ncbi:DUF3883 domain-containing protein [Pedobacter sp. D749]|uniref:DUF3883 domain-containing protein n=1 Tax=Pedobacter sp. D749 TaxID=2856523 RepID=UPI001C560368|nr:DUF3883 domain-containing protein [Pedobacter sp. D749]QXU42966.1 DUF3883 domain-containing protein [Pedobacter sp. D749]
MDNELRIKLIELARNRRKIGYGNIMSEYGLNANDRDHVNVFAEKIGDISEHEHTFDRPMLSSLVMHSDLQTIGVGFYPLAEKLNHGDSEYLKRTYFERVMHEKCFKCWAEDELYYNETGEKKPSKPVDPYSLILNEKMPEGFENSPVRTFDFKGSQIDWLAKQKNDQELGLLGEELVIEYEKRVLYDNGCHDLIEQVIKVADGNGFDILSKELDGCDKFIEVKTTKGNQNTPFKITINEIKFSEVNSDKYYLYRLYDFNVESKQAEFNEYQGDLNKHFFFDPSIFDAFNKK